MTQNNDPDDDNGKGDDQGFDFPNPAPAQRRKLRPTFYETRLGRGAISRAALLERIVDLFTAEHTPDNSAVRAAQTRAGRIKLVLPVVEYVLSVESVEASKDEKAELIATAYSEIFGFGPLDPLFNDETITTITLESAEKVSIRRGHGDLEPLDVLFDDDGHMEEVVGRMLMRADVAPWEGMSVVEAGFRLENGRFLSMSLAAPPVTLAFSLDIRLHPLQRPTLDDLATRDTFTPDVLRVFRALVASDHGFMIVGQPECGKTMTLSALLAILPNPSNAIAVERTGEFHLPEGMASVRGRWPQSVDDPGITFGQQIDAQLDKGYRIVVLDEVRADEPHTIAPLLAMDDPPRMIWSVRASPDSKRLRAALGMLARRGDEANGENLVRNLFERIPFVISLRRLNEEIQFREIGEWYYEPGDDSVRYQALLQQSMGEVFITGNIPRHLLPEVEETFWTAQG